ncbi:MAG: PHP domain-containing protein [Acidiferrobacterales bacterium]|nr:PHP domain-containing protein [Acidiferrobacterales bacterium]
MTFDLHCHSYYSDGDLSPTDLVSKAVESGVTTLALTDHDTLDGIAEGALASARANLNFVTGVELSCTWNGLLIHVVGLNVELNDSNLLEAIEENKNRRLQRAEAMFVDLERHGLDVREEVMRMLAGRGVPTRPHFADALIALGKAKDKKQAFKRFLVKGKPGYVPMQWPDLNVVGHAITSAGGVAVLAHPLRYKLTRTKLCLLIKDMLSAGVSGIEVSTASTDLQQMSMLADLANKYNLLASIGSDFHSDHQPWARLGRVDPLPNNVTPVWQAF